MAWRFKASKFKNATPIVPKPEACVRDISVGSYQTYGNNIASSAAFMAFNVDHNGSSLAVLPVNDCGRKSKTMPLLHAHTDTITDMDFSPFHDGLLATGSQDCLVKVWHIPEKGLEESLSTPECTFSHRQRRVETVRFHPTADCLLTTSSYTSIVLWDVASEKEVYTNSDHGDVIQSVSWKKDGRLMVTSCKDKQLRILDPRSKAQGKGIVQSTDSHQNIKDSRVVWLGETNRVLTTGFDAARQREVFIRDVRKFNEVEKSLTLDSSTGILIPLYDPDTGMLFLAGKGDTTISYLEVTERDPYLVEGIRHSGEQTKGACLVPKRALNVMQAEVNKVLQLTSSSVIPIMYQVPRKSYRDFHSDLFPVTSGCDSSVTAGQWMEGTDTPVVKISLDPTSKNLHQPRLGPKPFTPPKLSSSASVDTGAGGGGDVPSAPAVADPPPPAVSPPPAAVNGGGAHSPEPVTADSPPQSLHANQPSDDEKLLNGSVSQLEISGEKESINESATDDVMMAGSGGGGGGDEEEQCDGARNSNSNATIAERRRMYESRSMSVQEAGSPAPTPTPLRRRDSLKNSKGGKDSDTQAKRNSVAAPTQLSTAAAVPKRTSTVFGRVSKFRHLKGTPAHKSLHIENVRNVSRQISGECDGFQANKDRVAVPLSGPGGKIAIFELSKPGKLPDGVIPALVQGTNVMDFVWDPFDTHRLAVACDDGSIKLWKIPRGGLTEPTNEPEQVLLGHQEKVYFVKFHPLASDVLASGSYDMTVRVWDLSTGQERLVLHGHTDQMLSMAWSPCGRMFATACKDTLLRVYDPRKSDNPVGEGKGPVGSRGARVVWAIDGAFIVVTGFDKVSERQIMVYRREELNTPLATVGLDVSPAILIPFYDEDSSTLFLTGRGDSTIYTYEVSCEAPYLCPLSHHRCPSLHQGLSFLDKSCCDVTAVEFARAFRLTNTTIEPLSFTVPRIKVDLFQDDLFPPTKVSWKPSCSAADWFSGINPKQARVCLKPDNMDNLSDAQGTPSSNNAHSPAAPVTKSPGPQLSKSSWSPEASAKEKQEELQKAMSSRLEVNTKLEQERMEGVDEKEWDE